MTSQKKFDYPKQPIRYNFSSPSPSIAIILVISWNARADSHPSAHRCPERPASATLKGRGEAPSA